MNAKHGYAATVLMALLAGPLAWGQAPSSGQFARELPAIPKHEIGMPAASKPNESPISALPDSATSADQLDVKAYAPDAWVYQQQPDCDRCCGPMGKHGPIGSDIYVRVGPSFPVSGGDFSKSLRTGFELMGGGRSLFFTPSGNRAWAIDLGLSYTYNDGFTGSTFDFQGAPVTLRGLHRTAVSLGVGHDWFLLGPGFVGGSCGSNIRFGLDAGGRWGTSHLDMNFGDTSNYAREHDTYFGAYAAAHLDVEVPMGAWTFFTGLRGEYSYSSLDYSLNSNTDLHDINLLLMVGVRY